MNTALNRTSVALLTNKSGGSVAQGDVVIVDSANAAAFTTTTTSSFSGGSIGVVLEPNGIADNAIGTVAFGGYVPVVNLSGSASLGDLFHAHSVAKQALRHAAPVVAGDFGQVLGTGTTPAAFLWGQPAGTGGSGSSTFAGDTDVSIASLANLDQVQYQTGDSKYHNVKGGMVKHDEKILIASAASIALTPITGYRNLLLHFDGRGDAAAANINVSIQFNADTAANYDYEQLYGDLSGSTGGTQGLAQTSALIGGASAATAPTGVSSGFQATLLNYGGTTFQKHFVSNGNTKQSTASGGLFTTQFAGWWRSTAAITAVLVLPSSGNFIAGTTATLYGLV